MRIEINTLKSRIITDNPKLIQALGNLYSFKVPGSEYSTNYRRRGWDGKKHFISKSGVFRTGLLHRILKDLDKIDCSPELPKIEEKVEYGLEHIENIPYYDYQEELINKALQDKRGVIKSPTGSGKTLITAGIIKSLSPKHKKMIILFNAKQLLTQTYEFLHKVCKINNLGICYGEGYIPGDIMLCTVQSIEKVLDTHLDESEVLIIDEVHEFCNGKTTLAVIESFPKASFRIGLTATPPSDPIPRYNLEGAIGPIWEVVSTSSLIEDGKLTKPIIQLIKSNEFDPMDDDLTYGEIYDKYIVLNANRNNKIRDIVNHIGKSYKDSKILILTKSLEHTAILHELIDTSFKLQGEDDIGKRYKTISEFLSKKASSVLIGTKILQTGINIEEITHLINARGLKSEVATIQALGRALRKHKSKDQVYIYDFMDDAKYLRAHSKARKTYYTKENHEVKEL
jgi:superfamily II DNA or RNA helicase